MRIARFTTGGDPAFAFVQTDEASGRDYLAPVAGDPLFMKCAPTGQRIWLDDAAGANGAGEVDAVQGGAGQSGAGQGEIGMGNQGTGSYANDEPPVRLLAPVIPRSKVVGVGLNYLNHVQEMGHQVPPAPVLFLKPNTSVCGPDDPIVLPAWSDEVSYEVELAVVIGKPCRNIRPRDAARHIFGYTVGNDVTARDAQRADGQWARAKGFDSACPLGPWIVTDFDPTSARICSRVNGEPKQGSNLSDMIFDVPFLVSYISETMTLLPGDMILTGTPAGVGAIYPGDVVECEIEGIGTLRNPVVRR